jgi:arylsulfatase
MRCVANGISLLTLAALLMTAGACGQSGPAPGAGQAQSAAPGGAADVDRSVDRTALPIPEPTRPAITELDARNVKAPPPIFEGSQPCRRAQRYRDPPRQFQVRRLRDVRWCG